MIRGLRTFVTLGALAALLVVGAAWGWAQVKQPFPGKVTAPTCVVTAYAAGDTLAMQNVTVSVLNASQREGLAGRTMQALTDAGFAEGDIDNAPSGTHVATAEIWVTDRTNPAARLVRSRLGDAAVVQKADPGGAGVVVVVGDAFTKLAKGRESVTVHKAAQVCGPTS